MAAANTMSEAFVEAYAEMSNPKKNATNPAFKSKYANLEELLNVTRPILAATGFALVQEPVSVSGEIGVHTKLVHASGEGMDFGSYTVPLAKHDAQGAGSAITYCRRYAIASIFGLAQEDDDANAASDTTRTYGASGSETHAPATPVDNPRTYKLTFGKHKDKTLGQVDVEDHGYVVWLASHADEGKPASVNAKAYLDATESAPPVSPDDPDIPF